MSFDQSHEPDTTTCWRFVSDIRQTMSRWSESLQRFRNLLATSRRARLVAHKSLTSWQLPRNICYAARHCSTMEPTIGVTSARDSSKMRRRARRQSNHCWRRFTLLERLAVNFHRTMALCLSYKKVCYRKAELSELKLFFTGATVGLAYDILNENSVISKK